MFEARLPTGLFRKKTRVVLDSRFPFLKALEVGDEGQIEVVLEIEGKGLEMDESDTEYMFADVIVKDAKPFISKGVRFNG